MYSGSTVIYHVSVVTFHGTDLPLNPAHKCARIWCTLQRCVCTSRGRQTSVYFRTHGASLAHDIRCGVCVRMLGMLDMRT